jgi:hypothetical protein
LFAGACTFGYTFPCIFLHVHATAATATATATATTAAAAAAAAVADIGANMFANMFATSSAATAAGSATTAAASSCALILHFDLDRGWLLHRNWCIAAGCVSFLLHTCCPFLCPCFSSTSHIFDELLKFGCGTWGFNELF